MDVLPPAVDLIDGRRQTPTGPLPGTLDDPNTGVALQPRLATSRAEVERAIAAAHAVHEQRSWADLGVEGRAQALLSLAGELAARAPRMALAESINTGTVIGLTTPITAGCSDQVRGTVEELRAAGTVQELPARGRGGPVRWRRDPWGPAVVLAPWNAPAPVAVGRVAAALAAGCPVILKPSEWAPGSCDLLADAAAAAGLPRGVFQLVHGGAEVGAQVSGDARVRAIALTGGQPAGRAIAAAAAPHFTRLQLELGGNNPVIVREDADLSMTARALARGMTILNGQWCEGPGRVFVPSGLHDALVEALLAELAGVVIGPSTDSGSAMGPIAYRAHRDHLRGRIALLTAAGATARPATTDLPRDGWFLSPTVVTGADADAAQDEIFGPVVTLHPVDGDEQALAAANASPDGLAGYVFGADTEAALALGERLRGGEIKVNGTSLFDLTAASHQSFWGTSGYGGHGAGDALEFFRGNRIVGVDDPDAPL